MRFELIKIENFLSVGAVEASLENRGLVLVQGENKDDSSQDSNGSGKSSFADAICWCLYGQTARGESGDRVVNQTEGKNCRVSITIDDEGERYIVTRHRKHEKGKNRLELLVETAEGDLHDLSLGTDKLTQQLVTNLLGCTVEVFTSVIYAGQDQAVSLPDLTDSVLKSLVEEAAGITRLEAAYEKSKKVVTSQEREFDALSSKLDVETARRKDAEESLASMTKSKAQWDADRKKEVTNRVKAIKLLKARFEERNEGVWKGLSVKRSNLEATLAGKGGLATKTHEESLEKLAELEKKQEVSARIKGNKEHDLESCRRDLERTLTEMEDVREKIGKPCSKCSKPIEDADVDAILDTLKDEAEDRRRKMGVLKNDLAKSIVELLDVRKRVSDFKNAMPSPEDLFRESESLQRSLDEVKSLERDRENARNLLAEETKGVKERVSEENPFEAHVKKNKCLVEELKELIAETECTMEDAEQSLLVNQEVKRMFSPSGIRAYILDTVTPFLNERTAHYLTTLTDGNIQAVWNTLTKSAKGDYREKFSIEVKSATGSNQFKGLSGGEKRKVRLATSMALQDLVASRATKPIDLFVADEIDHALDEAGLERLMVILKDRADVSGTVLVISHNSLSDWISNSVVMVKEGGVSRMEGSAL